MNPPWPRSRGLLVFGLLVPWVAWPCHAGGEQLYKYRVSWNGIPAAHATILLTERTSLQPPTSRVWIDMRTNRFVDLFWSLRAQSVAEVDEASLRPLHFQFDRRVDGRPEETSVEADADGVLTGRYARPGRYRLTEVDDAGVLDPIAAVLRVRRRLPPVGAAAMYEIFTGEARFRIELHRRATEAIDVPAGRFAAARIEPVVWRLDRKDRDDRVRRVTFWVTEDAPHTLLRVRSDIFIGAIYADLTDWARLGADSVR